MWMTELPPFVPFFIAALLAMVTRGSLRNLILLATPVLGGLHLWFDVSPGIITTTSIMEFELQLMRTDRLSLLFGYLFHIASFIAVVFALQVRDTTQHVSSMLYAGSALGCRIRRRSDHTVYLLGTARDIIGIPDMGAPFRACYPGGYALPGHPGVFRLVTAGRCTVAL
jgi:hypothetical protein